MTSLRPQFVLPCVVLAALLSVGSPTVHADGAEPAARVPALTSPAQSPAPGPDGDPGGGAWQRLPAPAGKGKQDDVFFTDALSG